MNALRLPSLALLFCTWLTASTPLSATPVISGFSPASGQPGDTFIVTGKNLDQTKLLLLGGYGCIFQLDTNLNLVVTVPDVAASGPIIIYASDSVVQSQSAFAVILPKDPPTITALDALTGPIGLKITVTGSNFLGASAVSFGGAAAEFLVTGNSRIVATLPPKAQNGSVLVTTPIGTAKSPNSFTVSPSLPLPQVLSFKPITGSNGTQVTISGGALTGIKGVFFGGMPAPFQEMSDVEVLANVPTGALTGPITVQTTNGSATSLDNFTVLIAPVGPWIEGFSSWQGKVGDKIRIRGGGFTGIQTVLLGKVAGQFTVLSSAEIELVIPQNSTSAPVFILADTGQATSEMPFIVSDPNLPPPATPILQPAVTQGDGQVRFEFLMDPFHPYLVEFADALTAAPAAKWSQFFAEQPRSTPQVADVVDASGSRSRFFRVTANLAGVNNWDFELGLAGWTAIGNAFAAQPVFGEAYLKNQTETSDLVNAVGGDYWNVRVHLGHHGDYWIGTGQEHPDSSSPILEDPTVLDARTGTLASVDFRLTQPWISFLIGGGFSAPHGPSDIPTVEIDASPNSSTERALWRAIYPDADRGFFRVSVASVLDGDKEMMRRHVINLSGVTNHSVHIRIIDNSTSGHINVDDFRFSSTDPRPDLIPAGNIFRDPDAPVWGLADTHTHPAANLGFGRKLISGFPDGSPELALSSCESDHGWGGESLCFPGIGVCAPAVLMSELVSPFGHRTGGYPYGFDGWPNVLEQGVHEQMYIDWIRRAWQGGLRLMVAHAVHNRILADMYFSTSDDKADIPVAELQIQAIKTMVGRHSDFMEIALSPRDARRIIHSGRLAVVLGIEEDRPFLTPGADTSDVAIAGYMADAYTRLGVRHLFMMHLGDNPYGGFAMYNPLWIYNNWWINNGNYPTADNPTALGITDPLEWRFEAAGSLQVGSFFLGVAAFPPAPIYPAGANINTRALQSLGRTFIREMMRHGMILDVDHMGIVTKNGALDLVEAQHYPVISGHSGFTEQAWQGAETSEMGKRAAESDLTPTLVARLQALGGMVSPITLAKDVRGWSSKVPDDLPGSAKSWAQSYLYALDHMAGANVGLGTDFGLVHGSGPRFGMKAAFVLKDDDARKPLRSAFIQNQTNGVRYAETILDYREPRFQGPNEGDVYDGEQKEYWEATALFESGADPDHVAYPLPRTDRIKYVSRGMRAQNDAQLAVALTDLPFIPGDSPYEVRAGYYVRNGLLPQAGDNPRVTQIFNKLLPIWNKWQDMQGNNVPLHRCRMNCIVEADPAKPFVKDWDINLDGMAHYGLLPDFLQDLKNCGLDREDLKPLFNSAEAYIRLWERCERSRLTGP